MIRIAYHLRGAGEGTTIEKRSSKDGGGASRHCVSVSARLTSTRGKNPS